MKKARSTLTVLLLGAVTIQILWLTVEPLIPYLIAALVVVLFLGFIYYRMTRW